MKQWIAMTALALIIIACSSESSNSEHTATRASAACVEWQQALCNWAQRCGASAAAVAECREDATAISCISDERAKSCAATLSTGSCTTATGAGCDLSDMADRVAAKAACTQFANALCDSNARCARGTTEECLKEPSLTNLCEQTIGHRPSLDRCIADVRSVSCSTDSVPASCNNVIVVPEK